MPTTQAPSAQRPFYCALCQKGYARMHEYDAHLGSYDHSHKQRLRDMKAMVRDPGAGARARRAEAKADGIISMKLEDDATAAPASSAGSASTTAKVPGFKRSGFKSAFAPKEDVPKEDAPKEDAPKEDTQSSSVATTTVEKAPAKSDAPLGGGEAPLRANGTGDSEDEDSSDTDGYEHYDPRYPTD